MVEQHESRTTPDLPRTDKTLDLVWWTKKMFEVLVLSKYGEFDEENAIEQIEERYGVKAPTTDDEFWRLQQRLTDVSQHDETDFIAIDIEQLIEDMTKYDDLEEGEQ